MLNVNHVLYGGFYHIQYKLKELTQGPFSPRILTKTRHTLEGFKPNFGNNLHQHQTICTPPKNVTLVVHLQY